MVKEVEREVEMMRKRFHARALILALIPGLIILPRAVRGQQTTAAADSVAALDREYSIETSVTYLTANTGTLNSISIARLRRLARSRR